MAIIWKGGPGHKAPYRTTHVRVPEPIKAAVQEMCDDFKRGALIDSPASEAQAGPDIEAAIAILTEALSLKANAGGKIKTEIKAALAILRGES
jgi:hypothetical protein